jgi:hypothetical protein
MYFEVLTVKNKIRVHIEETGGQVQELGHYASENLSGHRNHDDHFTNQPSNNTAISITHMNS